MNVLEARRRLLGAGVYKKTVTGNPAIAQGSLARMYPGITMQGWTEQDGTPTPESPVPIVSAGDDGEINVTVQGGNLVDESTFNFNSAYWNYENGVFETERGQPTYIYKEIKLCHGYYTFSVDCRSINGIGKIQVRNGSEILYSRTFEDTGRKSISFEAKEGILYRILFGDNENGAMSFMNVMLNEGSTALPYEPYKSPQTVLLTSDRPLTKWDRLEKRDGQWGWVYKSNMLSAPKAGYIAHDGFAKDHKFFTAVNLVPDIKISSNPQAGSQYCNICNLGNPYEYAGNLFWIYRYSENKNGDLRIGLSDTSIDTKELFEQYISDKDIYIWYETEEETFAPLSESEQEQMNALYTFRPTTVLSNDAGCEMSLTYKTRKSMEVTT